VELELLLWLNLVQYADPEQFADGHSRDGYEGDTTGGYNPNCRLWSHLGFDYNVGLYDAADHIEVSYTGTVSNGLYHPSLVNTHSNTQQHRFSSRFNSLKSATRRK